MLLIANFNSTLGDCPPPGTSFFTLASQIATALDEPAEQTFLVSVLPKPRLTSDVAELSLMAASPSIEWFEAAIFHKVEPANLYSILTDNLDLSLDHFKKKEAANLVVPPLYSPSIYYDGSHRVEVQFDPARVNFNRLSEQLLYLAGLGGKYAYLEELADKEGDEDGNGGDESKPQWNWQDGGPVAIIPPDDPQLAVFVGHALTHYLSEGDIWSGLYVVTSHLPLRLQEWD